MGKRLFHCLVQKTLRALARDAVLRRRSDYLRRRYRRIFPTRLAAHRQAVQEFITTAQGYRLATSNGGVLTGRGADIILMDDPLKPEEALSDAQRQAANEWFDHSLYGRRPRLGARVCPPPSKACRPMSCEQKLSNRPICHSPGRAY